MRMRAVLRLPPRRLGVRLRSAIAAALVVAVAAVLAGALLLGTARGLLLDSVATTATDRANQVTAALRSGDAAALAAAMTPAEPGRTMVQVLDASGRVVRASPAFTADRPSPASGAGRNPPGSGGDGELPASGAGRNPPGSGGDGELPASRAGRNPPASDGDRELPASGGDRNPAAPGGDRELPAADRQPAVFVADRPLSALRPAVGRTAWESRRLRGGRHGQFRVLAAAVQTPAGVRTVLVAESMETVDEATRAIVAALLAGMPLLALVVGVATFVFVGRTLRPVEAMTHRAATITATNLHARLPVPGSGDEIAALAATMNTMLDRIEVASAAQRRFVADASHELRSPLATIHANADLLRAADLEESAGRSVTRIHRESTRLARLVDDLLLLARVDDAALRPRRAEVDLDDLVYAARERVAVERPALRLDGDVVPVRVIGDADQLHRALRNLVDNAMRHARDRITITLGRSADQAEIVVGNDGPEILPPDRERIFDRFVRLDDSRARQDGGTGLGLSIAREIATLHDGTLTVDDLPEGAVFRLRLPATDPGVG